MNSHRKENEAEVYAVHIRQENPMSKIMNENFVSFTKKCGAVFVVRCKDPVRYLASYVLPDRKRQENFAKELQKQNIAYDADEVSSFVDCGYIKDIDLPGWEELRKG